MERGFRHRRWATALAVLGVAVSAFVAPNAAGAVEPLPEVDCVSWETQCSPQKAVQIVTYNVKEGFGGADQMFPVTCPQSNAGDPAWVPGDINGLKECTYDSRNTATRVATLTRSQDVAVPDVVLLQETTGAAARRFAQYLGWRFNDQYDYQAVVTPPDDTTSICEVQPSDPTCVEKAQFEAENNREVKAERDTAIVINATTMQVLGTKWVTHKQQLDEVPAGEVVRWRYTPVAHLMKRNGSWSIVTASMHWTGLQRFTSYAKAEQARARWAGEVAAAVDAAYTPVPLMRTAGGDLNAHRCVDGTPWPATDDAPPADDATCTKTTWWQTFQDQNFRDAGHVARNATTGAVENTSPGERIDYIWSRKVFCSSKTDSGYTYMPARTTDPADGLPTDYASDHRALRAMFAYEATTGC